MFPHAKLVDPAYLVTKSPISLFDGTATASITLTGTWPAGKTGRCKVTISVVGEHTSVTGTLTIDSETLTFTQAGTKVTSVNRTANPTVTSSGLDCHMHITVIDTGGQDIEAETLTAIDIKFTDEQKYYSQKIGDFITIPANCITDNTTCQIKDIIRYGGRDMQINAIHGKDHRLGLEQFRILEF